MNWLIILGVLLIDQATKYLTLEYQASLPLAITPFFNLVFVYNRGISFGLFHSSPTFMQYGLIFINLAITVYLIHLLKNTLEKWSRIAFCLIIGGAIGNLLDRFIHGAVIDFLDFHWGIHSWPAFNVADSCIVIGVGLLLWRQYKGNTCASLSS